MNTKILTPDRWQILAPHLSKQTLVLTNGCFDILHVGHIRYLQQAKAQGDLLLVGVNSDASVQRLKGPTRPVNSESDRAEVLAALACIDYVMVFPEDTADALIERVHPQIYVKAGDYGPDTLPEWPTLERLGIEGRFMPFVSGYSTTQTIDKISS